MNIDRKIKTEKRNELLRKGIYFLMACTFYVIMTTVHTRLPMPLLLIPLAICTAVFECTSPVYVSVFGVVCGLMLDAATGTLISFNGIIVAFCAMMTSLLFMRYLQRHILNYIILSAASAAVQSALHYLFFYLLWGYDSGGGILRDIFIPEFIMTNLWGLGVYVFFLMTDRIFGAVREHYIEDNSTETK